jgi:ABC-type multidrug transport system ATPase subunit
MYVVMFCHDEWKEDLEITTMSKSDNLFNFNVDIDKRAEFKTNKFHW